MTDFQLFIEVFWEWLERHGVVLAEACTVENHKLWPATVEMDKLKAGIAALQSRGFCD